MPLAVKSGAIAAPEALVPTVTTFDPLAENVPLEPLEGALKVTELPATRVVRGQPLVLASATSRLVAKAVASFAVWGVPPASVNVFGGFEAGHAVVSAEAGTGLPTARPAAPARPAARTSPSEARQIEDRRRCVGLIGGASF